MCCCQQHHLQFEADLMACCNREALTVGLQQKRKAGTQPAGQPTAKQRGALNDLLDDSSDEDDSAVV